MSAPLPSTCPPLADLVEHIHRATADVAPVIVGIAPGREASNPEISVFVVPPEVEHPAHALVGRRVPAHWLGVGLVMHGRMRHLDEDLGRDDTPAPRLPVAVTMVGTRDGTIQSVLERPDGERTAMDTPPVGWVPDAIHRSLAVATPAPRESVAAWIDAQWLAALVETVLSQPGRRWTWKRLVDLHPLWEKGPTPTPAELAARMRTFAETHPWSWVREHAAPGWEDRVPHVPAELGRRQPLSRWLDDGAVSRWVFRELPPGGAALQDLLDVLPTHVGDCLNTAMIDTQPGATAEDWWP